MTLADRSCVMHKGRIEQSGAPPARPLLSQPNLFVYRGTRLIGSRRCDELILGGQVAPNGRSGPLGHGGTPAMPAAAAGSRACRRADTLDVGIRPGGGIIHPGRGRATWSIGAWFDWFERLGRDLSLICRLWNRFFGARLVEVAGQGTCRAAIGDGKQRDLSLASSPGTIHLFDAWRGGTGGRLGGGRAARGPGRFYQFPL